MLLWKKSIVVTLLAVMIYNYAGYYAICLAIEWHLEEEMEESLLKNAPESLLEKIIYTGNEQHIHWEEEGREFLLNGQLYDVVKIKKENDKIVLLCINDKKEEDLVQQLSEVVGLHANAHQKSIKANFFKVPFDPVIIDTEELYFLPRQVESCFSRYSMSLLSPFNKILSPPPRA